MDREQKIYELGYLLTPLVPEEKVNEEISVLRGDIEKKKGLIIGEEIAKMRKLAYTIKKPNAGSFDSVYFGWIKFVIGGEFLSGVRESLKKNAKIVRFLFLDITKEESIKKIPAGRVIKRKKVIAKEAKPKEEIKTEEIDKKLEELLGHKT